MIGNDWRRHSQTFEQLICITNCIVNLVARKPFARGEERFVYKLHLTDMLRLVTLYVIIDHNVTPPTSAWMFKAILDTHHHNAFTVKESAQKPRKIVHSLSNKHVAHNVADELAWTVMMRL